MLEATAKIQVQLEFWSLRIDHLAARTQMSRGEPSFDALVHIDELKALLALARAKIEALVAGAGREQPGLEGELKCAMNDLAIAIKDPLARRWP